jgi:hypothetical protein
VSGRKHVGIQAPRRGTTLVTANADECRQITGLAWEDWGT